MRTFRRLVSVLLLLCLAVGCAQTVVLGNGEKVTYSEAKAKPFDPNEHKDTYWNLNNETLIVSETGEIEYIGQAHRYSLVPDGDHFRIELMLYRTIVDNTPALTIPVGMANLYSDGNMVKMELLENPLDLFFAFEKTWYMPKTEPPAHSWIDRDSISRLQSHPDTEWEAYDPIDFTLFVDADGAVNGTILLDGQDTNCMLLIGKRDDYCALVRDGAKDLDDVLLFGHYRHDYERRIMTRRFEFCVDYDPSDLFQNAEEKLLVLEKQVINIPRSKWIGTNVHELLYEMEKDGWKSEAVKLLNPPYPTFYSLKKDNQTILFGTYELWNGPFMDECITGYVQYRGREVETWGGFPPFDHEIADSHTLRQGGGLRDRTGYFGYSLDSMRSFYFLDDCRVAGVLIDWLGTNEESDFVIYDALTGEIN